MVGIKKMPPEMCQLRENGCGQSRTGKEKLGAVSTIIAPPKPKDLSNQEKPSHPSTTSITLLCTSSPPLHTHSQPIHRAAASDSRDGGATSSPPVRSPPTALPLRHAQPSAMGEQRSHGLDHTRDPCPWVALSDFGGAFCMGVRLANLCRMMKKKIMNEKRMSDI